MTDLFVAELGDEAGPTVVFVHGSLDRSSAFVKVIRRLPDLRVVRYDRRGYGHSFGVLSHCYGREAGLELREDIDTVLEPDMVVSMEPMIMLPEGEPGAGGYREHDILVVTPEGAENITGFPYGPEHNIIKR